MENPLYDTDMPALSPARPPLRFEKRQRRLSDPFEMATMDIDDATDSNRPPKSNEQSSGNTTSPKEGLSFRDAFVGQKAPLIDIQTLRVDKLVYSAEDDEQWADVDANFEDFFADDPLLENPPWPQIRLMGDEKRDMCKSWGRCLIIKLLGKAIRFDTLATKLPMLWKLEGNFELIEMGMGFFFVKLQKRSDYESVLSDGPWVILQHYLTVRRWSPDFKISTASISSTLAWVRLPELPIQLFNRLDKLKEIGDCIGRFVKVDDHTIRASKGRYARIAVEIDLHKPLLPKYILGSEEFNVEYEGIRLICFSCGVFGHHQDDCPQSPEAMARKEKELEAERLQRIKVGQQTAVAEEPKYGTWMIATNRRRPNFGKSQPNYGRTDSGKSFHKHAPNNSRKGKELQSSSAFSALQDLEEDFLEENRVPMHDSTVEEANVDQAPSFDLGRKGTTSKKFPNVVQASELGQHLTSPTGVHQKIQVPIKNQVPIKSTPTRQQNTPVTEFTNSQITERGSNSTDKRQPLTTMPQNQQVRSTLVGAYSKDPSSSTSSRMVSSMNRNSSRKNSGVEGSKGERGRPYDRGPTEDPNQV